MKHDPKDTTAKTLNTPILRGLNIDQIGDQGDGMALYNGRPVYISFSSVGDNVDCEVTEDRNGNLRGTIIKFNKQSDDHQTPPCKHFGICGGCSVQHLKPEIYESWKRQSVLNILKNNRITPITIHDPIFIPNATRRRVTFIAKREGQEVTLGFHRKGSHDSLSIENCLLLTPSLMRVSERLKPYLVPLLNNNSSVDIFIQDIEGQIELVFTGELPKDRKESDLLKLLAELCESCNITRIGHRTKELLPIETLISLQTIQKKFGNVTVTIPIGNFLQPSIEGELALMNIIRSYLPNKKFTAMDLFSGIGTFTSLLLERNAIITAYEIDKVAVTNLQKALSVSPKSKAEQRHLFNEPVSAREMKDTDIVILDPPRVGASEQCEKLGSSKVKKIIYVSCNPASFARDANILINGGYRLTDLHIVDQFMWSSHSEVVGIFIR